MRKSQPIETNHDYTVGVESLHTRDGKETTFCGTRRKDNGLVLGVVKCNYGLIQNSQLVNMAEDVFAANGMGQFNRHVSVCRGGARLFARYDFRDKVAEVPKVGDKVGLRLTINNSFDGSSPVSMAFGALRLICTNGMTTMDSEFSLTKKHTASIEITSFKDALDGSLAKYSDILKVFGEMSEIEVSPDKGKLVISDRNSEKVLGIWAHPTYQEDRPRNLFSLYNSVTQWISHDFEANHFENAQKLSARVGTEFINMTRNPSRLQELVEAAGVS